MQSLYLDAASSRLPTVEGPDDCITDFNVRGPDKQKRDDPKTVPLFYLSCQNPQLEFVVLPIMMIGSPGFLGALRLGARRVARGLSTDCAGSSVVMT
jgi:hypothetical protein